MQEMYRLLNLWIRKRIRIWKILEWDIFHVKGELSFFSTISNLYFKIRSLPGGWISRWRHYWRIGEAKSVELSFLLSCDEPTSWKPSFTTQLVPDTRMCHSVSVAVFITSDTIEQSSPVLIDQPDQGQHHRDPAQDHHHVAQPEEGEVAGLESCEWVLMFQQSLNQYRLHCQHNTTPAQRISGVMARH